MATGILEKVVSLARVQDVDSETRLARKEQVENLIAQAKSFEMGIETHALEVLEKELENLKEYPYHKLSLEPLRWRDKNGLPLLAVFSPDSGVFEISYRWECGVFGISYRWESGIHPEMPEAMLDCYSDLIRGLSPKWYQSSFRWIKCQFKGLIPQDVKWKIKEAKPYFGDNIYVIAEPSDGFEVGEIVVPKADPLVVGFKDDSLWLIADFDTTDVESAMFFTQPNE